MATKQIADKLKEKIYPEPEVKLTMNSIKVTQEVDDDSMGVKFKVQPKVKFGSLLKGDMQDAFGNTALQLEFGREFTEQDVEVTVKINGNINSVLNSPMKDKNFSASFVATKRF